MRYRLGRDVSHMNLQHGLDLPIDGWLLIWQLKVFLQRIGFWEPSNGKG